MCVRSTPTGSIPRAGTARLGVLPDASIRGAVGSRTIRPRPESVNPANRLRRPGAHALAGMTGPTPRDPSSFGATSRDGSGDVDAGREGTDRRAASPGIARRRARPRPIDRPVPSVPGACPDGTGPISLPFVHFVLISYRQLD